MTTKWFWFQRFLRAKWFSRCSYSCTEQDGSRKLRNTQKDQTGAVEKEEIYGYRYLKIIIIVWYITGKEECLEVHKDDLAPVQVKKACLGGAQGKIIWYRQRRMSMGYINFFHIRKENMVQQRKNV